MKDIQSGRVASGDFVFPSYGLGDFLFILLDVVAFGLTLEGLLVLVCALLSKVDRVSSLLRPATFLQVLIFPGSYSLQDLRIRLVNIGQATAL